MNKKNDTKEALRQNVFDKTYDMRLAFTRAVEPLAVECFKNGFDVEESYEDHASIQISGFSGCKHAQESLGTLLDLWAREDIRTNNLVLGKLMEAMTSLISEPNSLLETATENAVKHSDKVGHRIYINFTDAVRLEEFYAWAKLDRSPILALMQASQNMGNAYTLMTQSPPLGTVPS